MSNINKILIIFLLSSANVFAESKVLCVSFTGSADQAKYELQSQINDQAQALDRDVKSLSVTTDKKGNFILCAVTSLKPGLGYDLPKYYK